MEPKKISLTNIAKTIRSKNAKTHHITLEIIFDNSRNYERIKDSNVITKELIASLYNITISDITHFIYFDPGMAIKITIKRPRVSGSPGESDVYGCQQYAPLYNIEILWPWNDGIVLD
jgi:hypothetical protein